jgi:hypothetical protein
MSLTEFLIASMACLIVIDFEADCVFIFIRI